MREKYYIYSNGLEFDDSPDLIICTWDEDEQETADVLFVSKKLPNYQEKAQELTDLLNRGLITVE